MPMRKVFIFTITMFVYLYLSSDLFFEKTSYDTIKGEKTMYMIAKSFSQKNTAEDNDFFKEMIEAMTLDRKRQNVIDYLKINEVE